MNLILAGDSVFDNGRHVDPGEEVLTHIRKSLPDWHISMLAKDGATTLMLRDQLAVQKVEDSYLLVSIGGNDALLNAGILDMPASSTAEVLDLLSDVTEEFEKSYRSAIERCLEITSRLFVCTIYHGNFPDPEYQKRVSIALDVFNSRIIKIAAEQGIGILDLRAVCNAPADFSKGIEPSEKGGKKISDAVVRLLTPRLHRSISIFH
ncbi:MULTISPECIES: SGNH/GDSL hydrolase family protein [unclassified Variovorax]|uniref:SGNH/GDSL hydrolase family protein n=1 Tax=unclassified Variovorax TaxID=663243 RepID=UPI003F4693BB